MKLQCHRILVANSDQIGNLRVGEAAGEPNESMFRFIDDVDPAFHEKVPGARVRPRRSRRPFDSNPPAHASLQSRGGPV